MISGLEALVIVDKFKTICLRCPHLHLSSENAPHMAGVKVYQISIFTVKWLVKSSPVTY